jgi:hypothetical protein
MSSTHDPLDFALAAAVVIAPMGGEEAEEITITKKGLTHITTGVLGRGGKTRGSHLIFVAGKKSAFNLGEDVVRLVKAAEATSPVKQLFGKNIERVVDAGRPIGMDRATGQLTNIYTVITDSAGELVTAFPGKR